jgi:uncharacterized membrane protein YqiK
VSHKGKKQLVSTDDPDWVAPVTFLLLVILVLFLLFLLLLGLSVTFYFCAPQSNAMEGPRSCAGTALRI